MPTAPHTRIRIVQSRHNARVKQLRAALARPSADLLGLEGMHLVEEALRSGLAVQTILVRAGSESLLDGLAPKLLDTVPEILSVPAEVLRAALTTETPQAIAALAVSPRFTLEQFSLGLRSGESGSQADPALLLVLAGVQDPGNLGTILRSAEAFGAHGIIALPGTATMWNAKSLRASMGSAFRLPSIAMSEDAAFALLRAHGIQSWAAVAPGHRGALPAAASDLRSPAALWIGNEGSGLPPAVIAACDRVVTIPCPGPVESLNAAVAAGVLLYEASRQRGELAKQNVPEPHPISR